MQRHLINLRGCDAGPAPLVAGADEVIELGCVAPGAGIDPVLIGDAYRRPTKTIVDADFGDVDALADVGIEGRDAGGSSKLYGAGAEVEVIVFDLRGPIVGEGILDAGAHHPAPASFVGSILGWS